MIETFNPLVDDSIPPLATNQVGSVPDTWVTFYTEHMLFVSRQLARPFVVLDVNKGPWAQVNYGTGKDVSDESIGDAKEPLKIAWHTDSEVEVPVWK